MPSPNDRKYSSDGAWIMINPDAGNGRHAGMTLFEVQRIGTPTSKVVFAVPRNASVAKGDIVATVSGTPATPGSDPRRYTFRAPAGGTIIDRNEWLLDGSDPAGHPERVGADPWGTGGTGGWLVVILVSGSLPTDLVDAAAYDSTHPTT